jgi:hypothetical protein
MTLIDGQDSNPWEQFETLGEIFGFVHKQHGLDGVRRTLELDTEGVFTREALHDAARELKAAGLTKAAAVVTEFAANSPSMLDLRYCDYATQEPYVSSPDNHYNIEAWRRSQRRQLQCAWSLILASPASHFAILRVSAIGVACSMAATDGSVNSIDVNGGVRSNSARIVPLAYRLLTGPNHDLTPSVQPIVSIR